MPAFAAWPWYDVVHVRIARWVLPRFDHVDGALRNVNAPDGEPSIMKANGRGQTDVSKADDPDGHVNV